MVSQLSIILLTSPFIIELTKSEPLCTKTFENPFEDRDLCTVFRIFNPIFLLVNTMFGFARKFWKRGEWLSAAFQKSSVQFQ
jgi:hypothetical protein